MATTEFKSWEKFKRTAAENPGYNLEIVNKGSYLKPDLLYKISTGNGAFTINRNPEPTALEGNIVTDKSSLIVLDVLQLSRNARWIYIDKELFKFGNSLYNYLLSDRKPFSSSDLTLIVYDKDSIRKHFNPHQIKESLLYNIEKDKRINGPFMKSLVDYYYFDNADDKIRKTFHWRFNGKNDGALENQFKDGADVHAQAKTQKKDAFALYDKAVDSAYSVLEKFGGFIVGLFKSEDKEAPKIEAAEEKPTSPAKTQVNNAVILESQPQKDLEEIAAEPWDRSKYDMDIDGTLRPKSRIDVRV
jgi:hypothetical protein